MAGYDHARVAGADRITAMRDVLAQRNVNVATGRRVFVGDPARAADPSAFAAAAAPSATDDRWTAADIAADSYPTADTAATTRRTPIAGDMPHQPAAARSRGLAR